MPYSLPRLALLAALAASTTSLALAQPASPASPASPAQRASATRAQLAALPASARQEKMRALGETPFAYFRGTAGQGWQDALRDPRLTRFGGVSETRTWVLGDAHPHNIGTFTVASGEVVYDLNDFDEAAVADYQVDLWRLGAGVELLGRELGLGKNKRRRAREALAEGYLRALRDCQGNAQELDPLAAAGALRGDLEDFRDEVAADHEHLDMLKKWTRRRGAQRELDLRLDDLAPVDPALEREVERALLAYGQRIGLSRAYVRLKSLARRLGAGTGSLGAARLYALIEGPAAGASDDRLLDLKEQGEPAGWRELSLPQRIALQVACPNQAARVIAAERALLGPGRLRRELGWLELGGRSYSVRPRSSAKDRFEPKRKGELIEAARQWGALLARAHARADRDGAPGLVSTSFEDEVLARAGYQQRGFVLLVGQVAVEFADRVEADWAAFCRQTTP